jgi:hypothetical protein
LSTLGPKKAVFLATGEKFRFDGSGCKSSGIDIHSRGKGAQTSGKICVTGGKAFPFVKTSWQALCFVRWSYGK